MIRVFLLILLPVLVPTIVYLIWMFRQRQKAKTEGLPLDQAPSLATAPWPVLIASSALLLAGGIVIFLFIDDRASPGRVYIPPMIENGEIVPGRHVPAGEAEPDKVFD
ncbi:MAG: hypothetical protein NXI16_10070 [Alphaproteobacteria bacterium]|nr:hypothetical protein [Alphaproteobacteria bacterium]